MRTLLLALVAISTVSFARGGFDWWDYFSNENWWHSLRDRDTRIAEANCLLYSERPPSNVIPEATADEITGIALSRHHIIPGNILLRFFNTALRENGNNNNQLGGLLQILGALADNFMDYYEGNDEITDDVREQLSTIRLIQLHYETGDEVSLNGLFNSNELARAIFYWMPGNIFMGPRNRADDPGGNFESNARFIVQNSTVFNNLRRIERTMNSYIQNRDVSDFNEVIEMLQAHIFMGVREPYPFQIEQWQARYMNRNGLHFYGINTNPIVTTTTPETVTRYFMKRESVKRTVQQDPLCFLPIVRYKLALRKDNLLIAANVLERTESGTGFQKKFSYGSWREWLEGSPWKNGWFNGYGIAKYGKSMADEKYGYLFNDKSFVAGVVGADLRFGNDSWTNTLGWDMNTLGGQFFFDKNGRPVALAVSDEAKSTKDKGWVFVYSRQRKWKEVPSYDIAAAFSSVFPNGQTECLDATAITFKTKKIKSSHDDGREFRSTRTRKLE